VRKLNKESYLKFLKKARHEAYVLDKNMGRRKNVLGFSVRTYDNGQNRLIILQTGLTNVAYIEIGYHENILVWNLTSHGYFRGNLANAYSRSIDIQRFMLTVLAFLKKSVGQPTAVTFVRGPESYLDQAMEYECAQPSSTFPITGIERIFHQEQPVYEANFCAQWLLNT
jgi:hypothetical protein